MNQGVAANWLERMETGRIIQLNDGAADNDLIEDHVLIALISAGDLAGLEMLYHRYSAVVFRLALGITGQPQQAEAVTEQVFLQAWKELKQFDGPSDSVAGWLFGMSINVANAVYSSMRERSADRRTSANDQAWMLDGEAGDQGDARAAVAALPNGQRAAIELARYGGLMPSAIAVVLGQSQTQVMADLRLGLIALQQTLLQDRGIGNHQLRS
ncbi:MAG: hypothetical protein NVSMB42_01960 [Herpetosiphon sp.]